MLYRILKYLRNFFPMATQSGRYEITDGTITLPFVAADQYFLIEGSVFNDGVYKHPAKGLTDETFEGHITALAIPKELLALVEEIEAWQAEYGSGASTPFNSESFGGYSYTRATNKNGNAVTWQDAFADRLNIWRKK